MKSEDVAASSTLAAIVDGANSSNPPQPSSSTPLDLPAFPPPSSLFQSHTDPNTDPPPTSTPIKLTLTASAQPAPASASSTLHRIKLRHHPSPRDRDRDRGVGQAGADVDGEAMDGELVSNERGGDGASIGGESRDLSRAATPASDIGIGGGKKRRLETPAESVRSARSRPSPGKDTPAAASPAPSPSAARLSSAQTRQQTINPAHPPDSLAIFAPPPPAALPQAIQATLDARARAGSPGAVDRDGDTMMRDAAEGFESRTRATRSRGAMGGVGVGSPAAPQDTRQGVTASGKEAKMGSAPKGGRKKGKAKAAAVDGDVPNQDFCSACRGIGRFLCCDGCPRSFHFMCLEPPLRVDELPEEETWYCKKCRAERGPSQILKELDLKPIPAVFRQLSAKVDKENPSQFRLPQEIRQFFAGVSTGGKGEYLEAEDARTKYDRKGFQEERDGHRLRDARARPVACYACGGSSVPSRGLTTDPEAIWRQIVSCDYCALSWHLDCLDPPLAGMPNAGRKWMCPNHVEHVLGRRRTTRNQLETVDVDGPGQRNNGNILVLPEEERERLVYEDMIINKRKYRVPERVIRLDFWEKLGLGTGARRAPAKDEEWEGEEEEEDEVDDTGDSVPHTQADITAARLILNLLQPQHSFAQNETEHSRPSDSDRSVQTPATASDPTIETPHLASAGDDGREAPKQKIVLKVGTGNGHGPGIAANGA